ncbi:MAG: hypothetical protein M1826_003925 [Phylliscum demangeonii]|nr:MAG: hypothetical protein M1826_003925 [Phylliscum demangeonii]
MVDPSSATETKRAAVLRNLGQAITEPALFQFDRLGASRLDEDGGSVTVGEMVRSRRRPLQPRRPQVRPSKRQRPIRDGPSLAPERLALLLRAIGSIPAHHDPEGRFVLGHPDVNYQNVFVDDAGHITGFIDRNGLYTVPRALGFPRYPSWITRDWNRVRYGWGIPGSREEDLPA